MTWSRRQLLVRTGQLAAAVGAAELLAACGGAPASVQPASVQPAPVQPASAQPKAASLLDQLIPAAKSEGSLAIFGSGAENQAKQAFDAFTKVYGIPVAYTRISGTALATKISTEFQAGKVDFDGGLLSDPTATIDFAGQGKLVSLADLPAKAGVAAKYWDDFFPSISATPLCVTYNTKVVGGNPLKTWDDILNPRWSGKISIPSAPGQGYAVISYYSLLFDKYGDTFWSKLKALNPRVVANSAQGSDLVAAGEVAMFLGDAPNTAVGLKDKGAPVETAFPDPSAIFVRQLIVPKGSPHPNAARLLANWLFTMEGQVGMNAQFSGATIPNVPGALVLPASAVLPGTAQVIKATPAMIEKWNAVFGK